jgi:hypothetical protein
MTTVDDCPAGALHDVCKAIESRIHRTLVTSIEHIEITSHG